MTGNDRDDDASPALDPRTIAELRALDAGQDDPFLRELIANFIEQSGREMDEIGETLRTGDLAAAGRVAHGLAGAAHTVGARRLGRTARAFEDACLAGSREDAAGAPFSALQREYATAVEALRAQL